MTDPKENLVMSKPINRVDREDDEKDGYDHNRLAPFNPTCAEAQVVALELLFQNSRQEEVLFDLGCGDGRFLVTAARRLESLKCVGVERDPVLVERALAALDQQDDDMLKARVHIRRGDVMDELTPSGCASASKSLFPGYYSRVSLSSSVSSDRRISDASSIAKDCNARSAVSIEDLILWEDATAVFVYLLPSGFRKIGHLLDALMMHRRRQRQQGTNKSMPLLRIVSYMFTIPGWHPRQVDRRAKGEVPLYMYDEETYDREQPT